MTPGRFVITLADQDRLSFVASAELYVANELPSRSSGGGDTGEPSRGLPAICPAWIRQLERAADQFLVSRGVGNEAGRTIIAGYPWFADWGSDTMIALPGLTSVRGLHAAAADVLRTFARFVDRGILPNRFPDAGATPEYNTADATLWFFQAIRMAMLESRDSSLGRELYPTLIGIIRAQSFLEPIALHLQDACMGTISEIFDGDPPHAPRGCFSQAWGVGEILRCWAHLESLRNPAEH